MPYIGSSVGGIDLTGYVVSGCVEDGTWMLRETSSAVAVLAKKWLVQNMAGSSYGWFKIWLVHNIAGSKYSWFKKWLVHNRALARGHKGP